MHTHTHLSIVGNYRVAWRCNAGSDWSWRVRPCCPWGLWWNRAWGAAAQPALIETKLPLLGLLFIQPKHWSTAPLGSEGERLPYTINELIHSSVNGSENAQHFNTDLWRKSWCKIQRQCRRRNVTAMSAARAEYLMTLCERTTDRKAAYPAEMQPLITETYRVDGEDPIWSFLCSSNGATQQLGVTDRGIQSRKGWNE